MRIHGLAFLTAFVGLGTLGVVACSDDGTLGGSLPNNNSNNNNDGGNGSEGGNPNDPRQLETLEGNITTDRTLTADKDWLLKGLVDVRPPAKLTIEKGTVIKGDNASKAILLIEAGAQIVAVGTADEPIIFTSQAIEGQKAPGDWGGLIILGNAPINVKDAQGNPVQNAIEGILAPGVGTDSFYGGDAPDDSSGKLQYVRVEYSGVVISEGDEVNGVTFGGVGRGTTVDHVQVRQTLDDCFEFFGGTVNAKYLACQHNEDDGFDFDLGYSGKLQFLVLQQDPTHVGEDNGFESDNDAIPSNNQPRTSPQVYNATVCGKKADIGSQQYGLLLRRNTGGTYKNLVVGGFQAALDLRDTVSTELSITNSLFWDSTGTGGIPAVDAIAFDESNAQALPGAPDYDDDLGSDEVAWIKAQGKSNKWATDPGITGCYNANAPSFGPATSLTDGAATPPDDGFFDPTATYMGAFKDANDTWATTGNWVVWKDR